MSHDETPSAKQHTKRERDRAKDIGNKLKKIYEDVADEPVPDEFLKLLEEADDASSEETDG